jgi:hypothetical protein
VKIDWSHFENSLLIINSLHAHGLYINVNGFLDTFLLSIDIVRRDVSYYIEVYWLLRQKVLEAFYEFIGEIILLFLNVATKF